MIRKAVKFLYHLPMLIGIHITPIWRVLRGYKDKFIIFAIKVVKRIIREMKKFYFIFFFFFVVWLEKSNRFY